LCAPEKGVELIKTAGPEAVVKIKPGLRFNQRRRLKFAKAAFAGAFVQKKARVFQDLEVTADCGSRDREWCGELADRGRTLGKPFKDSAADGIGEGGIGLVKLPGTRLSTFDLTDALNQCKNGLS
jgi:hypothetical protein